MLEKVYDSLPDKNGVVMIYGWLLNDKNTNPIPSSIFGLNIILYTYQDLIGLLKYLKCFLTLNLLI